MATDLYDLDISLVAGADLSSSIYYMLQLSAPKTVTVAGAADADLCGVLQNKPTSGHAAKVRRGGITKVKCGGTIAVDDPLTSDANGKAVKATSGQRYCCRALETGAANDLISAVMEFGSA